MNRDICDRFLRVDVLFRIHRPDEVVVATDRVIPEVWGKQDARIQRRNNILDHVIRRKSQISSLRPIHVDVNGRIIQLLLNARVGNSADALHLSQKFLCDLLSLFQLGEITRKIQRISAP